jgi:hypothetical protein
VEPPQRLPRADVERLHITGRHLLVRRHILDRTAHDDDVAGDQRPSGGDLTGGPIRAGQREQKVDLTSRAEREIWLSCLRVDRNNVSVVGSCEDALHCAVGPIAEPSLNE